MAHCSINLLNIAFLVLRAIYGVQFQYHSLSDDVCPHHNSTLLSFTARCIGVLHCSVVCARTPNCVSFCYRKSTRGCVLKNVTIYIERPVGYDYQYWRVNCDPACSTKKDCPEGYTYQGSAVDSCYKFETEHKQKPENASVICQVEGGHLVYLETTEERDHMHGLINNSTDLKEISNYWVGGVKDGDTWRWGYGGDAIAESIKPDVISSTHSYMKLKGSAGYELVTAAGRGTTGYVCEIDKS